ncbi:MAG: GNAT family N-acetyltransferase [Candidatus Thorarchaeota archaeon]
MFKGKTVQLRSFAKGDAQHIAKVYNLLETRRFLDDPAPLSQEDIEQWIEKGWEQRKVHQSYIFAIETLKSRQVIGVCGLFAISKINQKAELMIAIYQKRHRRQGYGSEALQLLLQFGFNQLNLHRIVLFTHDINKAAQHLYERIGFKLGGRRRQASFFEGAYHDLLLYEMLASEFSIG